MRAARASHARARPPRTHAVIGSMAGFLGCYAGGGASLRGDAWVPGAARRETKLTAIALAHPDASAPRSARIDISDRPGHRLASMCGQKQRACGRGRPSGYVLIIRAGCGTSDVDEDGPSAWTAGRAR